MWWAIRPSRNHPTLELRAPDSCTRIEDAVALAALYRALARHLLPIPRSIQGITAVDRAIAVENKWRAQRYGIHGSFVDRQERRAVSISEALDRLIAMLDEDINALGCGDEVAGLRKISGNRHQRRHPDRALPRGGAADRQPQQGLRRGEDVAGGSDVAISRYDAARMPAMK